MESQHQLNAERWSGGEKEREEKARHSKEEKRLKWIHIVTNECEEKWTYNGVQTQWTETKNKKRIRGIK